MPNERTTERPSRADDDVRAFEAQIRASGEERARWERLMQLLEEAAL
jgi:hypothetical protein